MLEKENFENELELYESGNYGVDFEVRQIKGDDGKYVELETGDIIFSTEISKEKVGFLKKGEAWFISDTIRDVEKQITGREPLSSHTAVYVGDNLGKNPGKHLVIEAIQPVVVIRPLEEKLKEDTYAFVRRYKGPWEADGRTKDQKQRIIIEYLNSQLGKKFDPIGGIKFALLKEKYKGDSNALYCSELVFKAYERAGIILLSGRAKTGGQCFPSELEYSSELYHVGFLKKSNEKEYSDEFEKGQEQFEGMSFFNNELESFANFENKDNFLGEKIDKYLKEKYDKFLDELLNYYHSWKIEHYLKQVDYFKDDPLKERKLFYVLSWFSSSKDVISKSLENRPLWYRILTKFIVLPVSVAAAAEFLFFVGMLIAIEDFIKKYFRELKSAWMFGEQLAFLHGLSRTVVCKIKKQHPPTLDPRVKKENKHLAEAYEQGVQAAEKISKSTPFVNALNGVDKLPYEDAVQTVFLYLGLVAFQTLGNTKKTEWLIKIYKSLVREADGKIYFGNTWTEMWTLFKTIINQSNVHEFELENLNNQNNNKMGTNYYLEADEEFVDEFENYKDYEDDEYEDNEYEDDEYEDDEYDEYEDNEDNETEERYAERLEELANESFESEYELEAELDNELEAMQEAYFETPVKEEHKKRKRRRRRPGGRRDKGRRRKGKGLFGKIAKAGAGVLGKVAGATPIGSLVKAGADLVTGDIKGMAKNLAKGALGAIPIPGAGVIGGAVLDAVAPDEGGGEGEVRRRRKRVARRVAKITRDGFMELADNLPDDLEDREAVYEASKDAMRRAMAKNGVRPQRPMPKKEKDPSDKGGGRRVIRLNPGEQVLIIRPKNKQ